MKSHKKQYERKRGEMIPLKTDLSNVKISHKLKNFKSQIVNEILNQTLK